MLKHILTAAPGSGPPPNTQRAAATGESVAERSDRDPPPKPEEKNRDNVREYSNYREASRQEPRYEYSTRDQLNETVQSIKPEARNNLINRIEHHRNEYHYRSTDISKQHDQYGHHRYQNTSRNGRLSVNAVQRLPQPLNVSTLDSSKHSQGGTSSSASPGGRPLPPPKFLGPPPRLTPASLVPANVSRFMNRSKEVGIKEMLTSLGLLCLVSLLLALLSLIFLLKISPVTSTDVRELLRAEQLSVISAEEYVVVYEVTLALCALTLSLNLCCLLVCAVQFLFAVKLVNSPDGGGGRTNKYLQKSAVTRVCAVGGFFISIPVFLTGIILYTFIQFHSTPAIVTSVFIGLGIIFCGCAMVHNVFVWQKEKTNAVKAMHSQSQILDQPIMNSTQNIGTPQSIAAMNGNGFLTNGHISNSANTTHGTNMSFHNTTGGTTYSHHPITILPNGPYIIRPSTGTPPTVTVGDLAGGNRPPRPPRPPAPGSVSPPGVPTATLDLSHVADPHELSTLV